MALKKKKKGGGIPEWVVTFGDMMSLLLCFFILLQMFSELKKDHEYQRVVTAIKEAFGYAGGVGVLPVDDPPTRSVIETLEAMAAKRDSQKEVNNITSTVEGIDGPKVRVRKLREGIVFTIGGPSSFQPESAEIRPAVREAIASVATMLQGRKNKIVIRGHAASKYLALDSRWRDLDELSYARAINVRDVLISLGIDDRHLRIEVVGDREPVNARAVEEADAAENRRVEIILSEQLVDEVNTDHYGTEATLVQGG